MNRSFALRQRADRESEWIVVDSNVAAMQRSRGTACSQARSWRNAWREWSAITLAADKGYDTKVDFVKEMRGMNVTPHVSQNTKRQGGSAIDERTTRHDGHASESAQTETNRRSVWLGQDGRHVAEDSASRSGSRRVGLHVHRYCLQPGANAESVIPAVQSM